MTDASPETDLQSTTLAQDLLTLDQVFDQTKAKRQVLADKLGDIIQGMTINVESIDARTIEVQMQMINAYSGLLTAQETGINKRAMAKLKRQEAETNSAHSASVAELLAQIGPGSMLRFGPYTPVDPEPTITRAFEQSGLPPVSDIELRTDPNDLS